MNETNHERDELRQELDLVPEKGELEEKLRDKQIFGVYDDEDGADRAIRQLNKLGYNSDHIFVYSKDLEKARRITEESQKDVNILSCSDGTDFIGESYHQGDIVLCVLKDAQRFRGQANPEAVPKVSETTESVAMDVAEEKRKA